MKKVRLRLPSPAMVVALTALTVGLSGTSYAATRLASHSVGSAQLRTDSVTSSKVKDGSLRTADFSSSARTALTGAKGATGATGPAGATGAVGATGSTGTPGLAGAPATKLFAVVTNNGTTATSSNASGVTATTRNGTGAVTVTFNRSLAGCAVIVSPAATNGGVTSAQASVNRGGAVAATDALVGTFTAAGSLTDSDFQIAAFC